MGHELLKDTACERRSVNRRLSLALAAALAAIALLGARMAQLQVADYEHFATLSQENRVRLVAAAPTRGLIYDRNGVLLAENVPAYRLVVTPEQVDDMEATLAALGEIVTLRPTDLERFRELNRRQRRFQEIPVKLQLTQREVARLAVNRHRFPGVEVKAHLIRQYPLGDVGAHAVGYVGRISERELQRVDPSQYQGSSHIGKTGIERYYEDVLHGEVGLERVETNALGRVLRTLDREPPTPGKDVHLSLDIELQRTAERALGDHSGAVIALDPGNGEVLAFASQPTFDPNLFVNGISIEDYRRLQTSKDNPLFNRGLRGQYPPGSTIKPFLGLAALESGVKQPDDSIRCAGTYSLPGVDHRWRDWKRWGHGEVDLHDAIAQSCDIYFYGLAYQLGISAMHDFLAPFGFGGPTGIDLPGELDGVLPSKQWKRRAKGEPWYHGETVITGIGQGFTLATPIQLAYATATLANRGRPVTPHLVKAIREPGEAKPTTAPIRRPKTKPIALDRPHRWESVIEAMESVVHGRRGTARRAGADAAYRIAGKTGTAQVFGMAEDEEYDAEQIAEELRDHALFVAFAPAEAPEIAVVVVVENGGSGSGTAAPIARQVMDAWLRPQAETRVAER